jgi:tetratricopeptide (TPR) repeat protein
MALALDTASSSASLSTMVLGRPLAGMRAMVIASPSWSQRTVVEMLQGLGVAQVDIVHDAATAEIQLELGLPHVVVSAAHLADGTEAVDLIPRLRQRGKLPLSSAVVVVGRERDAKSITALAEACTDLVLIWPFETSDVVQRVTALMDRRRALFDLYQAIDDKDLEAARLAAQQAVQSSPKLANEAWRVLSGAFLSAGKYEQALEIVQQARQTQTSAWAVLREAQVLTAQEKYDQAAKLLSAITQAHPQLVSAHDALADLRAIQGDWKGALESAGLASGHSSTVLSRQKRIGLLSMRQGQWPQAEQALLNVSQANGGVDIEVEVGLLRTLLQARKPAPAASRLGHIERVFNTMPEARWARAIYEYTTSILARRDQAAIEQVEELALLAQESVQELPVELIIETVQLCADHGLRQSGFAVALALTRARRATRIELHRLRRLIDTLGLIPATLIQRTLLESSWQRLSMLAGGADQSLTQVRQQVRESLDWWLQRSPNDPMLKKLSQVVILG